MFMVVVVAVGKRETAIYLKRWRRRWRMPVFTPYKVKPSIINMHSVRFDFTQGWIKLVAEIVHVFLNVGHQQGCKVVSSGTSVKIKVFSSDMYTIFIHSLYRDWTDGDILWYYESKRQRRVLKLSGTLGHCGEGIGGKGILPLTLKSRLKRYMEEKGIVAVWEVRKWSVREIFSQTLHSSDPSVVCRLLQLDSSRCSAAGGVRKRPRGRNNGASEKSHGPEVNWQLSTENIFLESRLCLLLLGRRGQQEVAL